MSETGQKREILACEHDVVRFPPPIATEQRHRSFMSGSVPEADSMRRSIQAALFDHLVGAGEQRRRHRRGRAPSRSCRLIDQLELGRPPAPAGRPASRP